MRSENSGSRSGWERLVDFASVPHFLVGASIFRVMAGISILYQYLIHYGQRHYLFGPNGAYGYHSFLTQLEETGNISLYALSESIWLFEIVYHTGIMVAVLWLVGWHTRVLTPLNWLLLVSMHKRFPALWDGGDNLIEIVLIYALFINVSAYFSFDAGRHQDRPSPHRAQAVAMFHNAAVLACALQLALMYGIAGLTKVQGATWQNGTALYYSLRGGEFNWLGYSHIIYENSVLLVILAYTTIAFQVSFPFILFLGGRLRILWIIASLAFHLGIMMFMGLITFAMFVISVDLMFITDSEYRKAGEYIHETRRIFVSAARNNLIRFSKSLAIIKFLCQQSTNKNKNKE